MGSPGEAEPVPDNKLERLVAVTGLGKKSERVELHPDCTVSRALEDSGDIV